MEERAAPGCTPRAEATRQRIIATAAGLIGVQGYGRTPLDAILERSRVSKGTFYHHFSSKEALGFAVLDHFEAEMQACLAERMEPVGDPLDRIDAMLDAMLEGQSERDCRGGCALGNLAAEVSDLHEGFRARLSRIFQGWSDVVASTLEQALRRSGRQDLDPQGMARYIVCSLEGGILISKVTREIGDVENLVRHLKHYVRQQFTI